MDFEPLAVASGPIATVLSPFAVARAPIATTLSRVAVAFVPMATEFSRLTAELLPMAILLSDPFQVPLEPSAPLILALLPNAIALLA